MGANTNAIIGGIVAPSRPERFNPELVRSAGLVIDLLRKNRADLVANRLRYKDLIPHLDVTNLTNREVKELVYSHGIGEYSQNDISRVNRALGSTLVTNPRFWGDTYEYILTNNLTPTEARKYISNQQRKLELWGGKFRVGDHSTSLSAMRAPIEVLQGLNPSQAQQVLHILEADYGFDLGEESLLYIPTIAHTVGEVTKLRKDWQAAFNNPKIKGLADVNPALAELLIRGKVRHAKEFKATTGYEAPAELLKGAKNPRELAKRLSRYLWSEQQASEQSLMSAAVIEKYGINKDGTLNVDAFLPNGIIEREIRALPQSRIKDDNLILKKKTKNKDIFARPEGMFTGRGLDDSVSTYQYNEQGQEIVGADITRRSNRIIDIPRRASEVVLESAYGDHPLVVGAQAGIQVGQGQIPTALLKTKLVTDTPLPDHSRPKLSPVNDNNLFKY